MKRRFHVVFVGSALFLAACAEPTPIAFDGQSKPKVLRCTMRPIGETLYPSNYLGVPATVRVGSSAQVSMFSTGRVDVTLNKIDYKMYPLNAPFSADPQVFMKKYFVDSEKELGLDRADPARKKNIENGVYAVGMTKQEIYTALGPPSWINFGMDATNLTLEQIMDTNRWEYRTTNVMWFPIKRAFTFDEGKLSLTVP